MKSAQKIAFESRAIIGCGCKLIKSDRSKAVSHEATKNTKKVKRNDRFLSFPKRFLIGNPAFNAIDVDAAVATIVRDPTVGVAKRGDLAGVYVYQFKCNGQLTSLAYEYDPVSRLLLLLGSHENFYRNLK